MTMSGGPTLGLGLGGMSSSLRLAPTSCAAWGYGLGAGSLNAAVMAGERMRQIQALQSRFSLASSDVRASQAGWKSVVERGC
jgi:hypothetical protein